MLGRWGKSSFRAFRWEEYMVGLARRGKGWACENVGDREGSVGVAVVKGEG